ncbi:MAG: hypothetical protein JOS17DRAFT_246668 [Linnemannia elongata]|nr:MAG: hypothetical protein JOS17DRAFT_246668 [Linnemannia elongata]
MNFIHTDPAGSTSWSFFYSLLLLSFFVVSSSCTFLGCKVAATGRQSCVPAHTLSQKKKRKKRRKCPASCIFMSMRIYPCTCASALHSLSVSFSLSFGRSFYLLKTLLVFDMQDETIRIGP